MAEIRAILGPHEQRYYADRIVWTFTGLRSNGEYARWQLAFWPDTRRFTTKPLLRHPNDDRMAKKLTLLPEVQRQKPQSGRVTDMLRARLNAEAIAEATRRAIAHGGR